jgi:HAD superfamily hydrolase (TIGR01459 family)
VDQYDVLLLDVWGVLHDGGHAYPGAIDCLERLRSTDMSVVIISNAARRLDGLAAELEEHHIDDHLYDHIVCSGELVWHKLKGDGNPYGRRCYFLGPERSRGILDGLDLVMVDSLAEADFILNTGSEHNPPDTSGYMELLNDAMRYQLPMLCANPDQVAVRRGVLGISAGAIARQYERLGGTVESLGKPHAPIYAAACEEAGIRPEHRVLAIGDGLETDIRGGINAGFATLLITGGIHNAELAALDNDLAALCAGYDCRPDYFCAGFNW